MKRRRALSHVGGAVERWGHAPSADALARALEVAPAAEPKGGGADDPDREHVHGFHAYPARMHPETAARLVAAFSKPGEVVLDPFCGSGTVLVEARLAGRRAVGADLNPLAVRLSRLKTSPRDAAARAALVAAARAVAKVAEGRRERRTGASRRYDREDVEAFEAHTLLELDSLRVGIDEVATGSYLRDPLELVLSAILVKVSRKASDTSAGASTRRIAAGYPSKLFARKAEELARRLDAYGARMAPGAPEAIVHEEDARRLPSVGAATVDAVITSPPYVATYDYLAHHGLRLRWLGLDASAFAAGETGSRRRYAKLDAASARATWVRELGGVLRSLSRVTKKGAAVVLLLADSAVAGEALRADAILAEVAPAAGFDLLARASQSRPHFHGETARAFEHVPRAEHALALSKR